MESDIRVCPKCAQTWRYVQGHFFCHPSKADIVGPILERLKAQGVTYTMVGKKLGVDRRAVGRWVSGKQTPSPERLGALQRLGTDPTNWS